VWPADCGGLWCCVRSFNDVNQMKVSIDAVRKVRPFEGRV
jgi:hypothetical protein